MVKITAFILFSSLLVILTYTTDILIGYINLNSLNNSPVVQIAPEKFAQDKKEYVTLRSQGYVSQIYTALYSADLNDLSEKYKVYPLGGLPNTKVYYCNEGYGFIHFTSDRYGFRNDNNIYNKKIELMIVGDSFINGACVNDDENIVYFLNKLGITSLNMGIAADSAVTYAARIKVFTPVIKPKYLIVNFYANDNISNQENDKYWVHYFKGDKNFNYFSKTTLFSPPSISPQLKSMYSEVAIRELKLVEGYLNQSPPAGKKSLKFNDYLIENWKKSFEFPNVAVVFSRLKSYVNFTLPSSTKLAINTAIEECQKYGCTPIITYIPNSTYWDPDYLSEKYKIEIKAYSERNNLLFIDGNEAIDSNSRVDYAPQGPHLSPVGYEKFSNLIVNKISAIK